MSIEPAHVILTDIEGTTSSISFVKDVLFPYARAALPGFIAGRADDPDVRRLLEQTANDLPGHPDDATVVAQLQQWIDEDRKYTPLKALQGMIWREGYARGDYHAHMYPDAVAALRRWHDSGMPLYVYSSGSVPAQKLFFGYSDAGDLTPLISGWFDTEIGHKRDADSYRRIIDAIQRPAGQILFLSDVIEELDAAREAGMRTTLLDRPEDYPERRPGETCNGHTRVTSFEQIATESAE